MTSQAKAAEILAALGVDFTLPAVDLTGADFQLPAKTGDLYTTITKPTLDDLTTGLVGGTGAFDKIMESHKAHLKEQYEKGLITGDQYSKVYVELTSVAMQTAIQFLLAGESSHWQAVAMQYSARKAEIDAVTAGVQLEIAKAQLAAQFRQAEVLEAQYVLTLMQVALADAQFQLTNEQYEAARAQTRDTLSDGVTAIAGLLGKQKDLYTQQIDSYVKDAQHKVAKLFTDVWITQKTIDDALPVPTQLDNVEIGEVVAAVRANNSLGS